MTDAEMVKKLALAYNYLDKHDDIGNAKPLILEVGAAILECLDPPLAEVEGWMAENYSRLDPGDYLLMGNAEGDPNITGGPKYFPVTVTIRERDV